MKTQIDRAPRDLNGIASDQNVVKIMLLYFQKNYGFPVLRSTRNVQKSILLLLDSKAYEYDTKCTQFREITLYTKKCQLSFCRRPNSPVDHCRRMYHAGFIDRAYALGINRSNMFPTPTVYNSFSRASIICGP